MTTYQATKPRPSKRPASGGSKMPTQQYTISHTGSVLEEAGQNVVDRYQNQVSPQRETEILAFECPTNFDTVSWVGDRDAVRFVPRAMESFTGTGSKNTFSLSTDLVPIAGEKAIEDQPHPVVVATDSGSPVDVESVDYATGEVTLVSAPALNNTVKIFPVIAEGTLKFRGINALDHSEGPVYPWPYPIYRWADMEQNKRGTEVNLEGSIAWDRNETLEVLIDSPRQVVWQDSDYPGAYVSTFEMDVQITF